MKGIFLFCGKAQHGKDSSAKIMKQKLGDSAIILHFADLLKMIARQYLHWDGTKVGKSRTLLQWLGTDRVRIEMGWDGYWAERVCDFIEILSDQYEYFLIPDCRFPNEVTIPQSRFPDCPVTLIKVVRTNFDNDLSKEQQQHSSETALDEYPCDYVIRSKNGLNNLSKGVETFIRQYFKEEN